jgi:hypothetical protein
VDKNDREQAESLRRWAANRHAMMTRVLDKARAASIGVFGGGGGAGGGPSKRKSKKGEGAGGRAGQTSSEPRDGDDAPMRRFSRSLTRIFSDVEDRPHGDDGGDRLPPEVLTVLHRDNLYSRCLMRGALEGFKVALNSRRTKRLACGDSSDVLVLKMKLRAAFGDWRRRLHDKDRWRRWQLAKKLMKNRKTSLRRTFTDWRLIIRVRVRTRVRLARITPAAQLRHATLVLALALTWYAVFVLAFFALWLFVACLANVGSGGALAAIFLTGSLLVGRSLMKHKQKREERLEHVRESVERRLEAARQDKYALLGRTVKDRQQTLTALTPTRWIESQLGQIRTKLTKLMESVSTNWRVLTASHDLQYIYDDCLLDNLRSNMQLFHAAVSSERLHTMLSRVAKTLAGAVHVGARFQPLNQPET